MVEPWRFPSSFLRGRENFLERKVSSYDVSNKCTEAQQSTCAQGNVFGILLFASMFGFLLGIRYFPDGFMCLDQFL